MIHVDDVAIVINAWTTVEMSHVIRILIAASNMARQDNAFTSEPNAMLAECCHAPINDP